MKPSMLDVHNLGRRTAQALNVRQDSGLTNCLQQCLTNAAAAGLQTCSFDVTCLCSNAAFKQSALSCMNSSCTGYGISDFGSLLDQALTMCANGQLDLGGSSSGAGNNNPTRTTTSTPRPTSTSNDDGGGGGAPIGAIVGGAVGGVVVLALVGILIWWLVRRSKNGGGNKQNALSTAYGGPTTPGSEFKAASLTTTATPAFVGGFNSQGQPPQGPTTASMYTNGTVSPPSSTGPSSDLGYVPPQNFAMFSQPPQPPQPQPPSSFQPRPVSHAYPAAPSSSSSGPSVAGDYAGYNPYAASSAGQSSSSAPLQPGRPPLQLHTAAVDPNAGGTSVQQWPQDVKRPLNVMTNEPPHQPEQEDAPPIYRQ